MMYMFYILTYVLNAVSSDYQHSDFRAYKNVNYKIMNESSSLQADSTIKCVLLCIKIKVDQCKSYIYSKNTSTCTPGSKLIVSNSPRDPALGVLYSTGETFDCSSVAGFYTKTLNEVSTCMWMSTEYKNYTDAEKYCKGLGAHLYTIKKEEKMNILNLEVVLSLGVAYWIGLDDMTTEGTFRWIDDQSELTINIWMAGQPDDGLGLNEDCVTVPYNDVQCSVPFKFVCEFY